MLMSFEQATVAAIRHMNSAASMRDEKIEAAAHLDDNESEEQRTREADGELAFASSLIVESVVNSAMRPRSWLEDQIESQEGGAAFEYLRAGGTIR